MVEIIVLFGLASPFLLMVWLWRARKSAQAKVDAQARAEEPVHDRFETEDVLTQEDGLTASRRNLADGDIAQPDSSGGETAGIRAMQGRR